MKGSLRNIFVFLLGLFYSFIGNSQPALNDSPKIDSLKKILQTQKEDTSKVNCLLGLGDQYWSNNDSFRILKYYREALALSKKINFKHGEIDSYLRISTVYFFQNGQASEAFANIMAALQMAETIGDKKKMADCYELISSIYDGQENYSAALKYLLLQSKMLEQIGDKNALAHNFQGVGSTYDELNNLPEASKYFLASLEVSEKNGDKFNTGVVSYLLGDLYRRLGNYKEALQKDSASLKILMETGNEDGIASVFEVLGKYYEIQGDLSRRADDENAAIILYKDALKNYNETFNIWKKQDRKSYIGETHAELGGVYVKLRDFALAKKNLYEALQAAVKENHSAPLKNVYLIMSGLDSSLGNYKQAYDNYKKYVSYRDSINTDESARKGESYRMQYEYEKNESIAKAEQGKKEAQQKRTRNLQYGVIAFAFLLAVFFYWSSRQRRRSKNKIEKAYAELKSTQAQLIQSEKMASLGELTAGIAHEIQNPLNFVNNFSEVNSELITEMREELAKGNIEEAKTIAGDINENEHKIILHGKRADAIVKGMLQHTRSSSGVKEPTDINALADEYFRLAYHGLRAKDKTFNATMKTDYDKTIGKVNIVPQDIGRVILNLITNAFYAVGERQKVEGIGYEPTVSVSTALIPPLGARGPKVEIKVADNGNGIPQKALDKIFQPFFTTKPTGQGTGLGLSLSYDIVKAHGGEINVKTKENEGSEFIIFLPANT